MASLSGSHGNVDKFSGKPSLDGGLNRVRELGVKNRELHPPRINVASANSRACDEPAPTAGLKSAIADNYPRQRDIKGRDKRAFVDTLKAGDLEKRGAWITHLGRARIEPQPFRQRGWRDVDTTAARRFGSQSRRALAP
jgi:hypothetical protein